MRWSDELSRRNSLRGHEGVQSTRRVLPLEEMPPRTINNLGMEIGPLPPIKPLAEEEETAETTDEQSPPSPGRGSAGSVEKIKKIFMFFEPKGCLKERDDYSLFIFPPNNRRVNLAIFKYYVFRSITFDLVSI